VGTLIMVADLVGDEWAKRAREACVAFVTGFREDTASVGVRLLSDLRDVFDADEVLSTQLILTKLHRLDESRWGDWYGKPLDARGLAKLVKPYGIKPKVVRVGEATPRGYHREDFHDAWSRYVPPLSATSATPLASHVADVADTRGKLCTICDQPLQEVYVRTGRITYPGCRAKTGGER
jgi:hypothetical protein